MEKITAYSLKLRQKVEVENAQLVATSNGRYRITGHAKGNPEDKVSAFVKSDEVEEIRRLLAQA